MTRTKLSTYVGKTIREVFADRSQIIFEFEDSSCLIVNADDMYDRDGMYLDHDVEYKKVLNSARSTRNVICEALADMEKEEV